MSPEAGDKLASVEAYTRSVMRDVGGHLGRELEWVAAVHTNTDQVHAHIVLRGVADGRELRLSRAAVTTGIRTLAQERATAELGPRTVDQVREAYQREAQAAGVTGLDRVLDRVQVAGRIDLATAPTTDTVRPHLAGRLQHLERMGLAHRRGARVFEVEPGFMDVLRQSQERERVGSEIRRVAGREAAVTRRCCGTPPDEPARGQGRRDRPHARRLPRLRPAAGEDRARLRGVAAHEAPAVRAGGVVALEDGGWHRADPGLALRWTVTGSGWRTRRSPTRAGKPNAGGSRSWCDAASRWRRTGATGSTQAWRSGFERAVGRSHRGWPPGAAPRRPRAVRRVSGVDAAGSDPVGSEHAGVAEAEDFAHRRGEHLAARGWSKPTRRGGWRFTPGSARFAV